MIGALSHADRWLFVTLLIGATYGEIDDWVRWIESELAPKRRPRYKAFRRSWIHPPYSLEVVRLILQSSG